MIYCSYNYADKGFLILPPTSSIGFHRGNRWSMPLLAFFHRCLLVKIGFFKIRGSDEIYTSGSVIQIEDSKGIWSRNKKTNCWDSLHRAHLPWLKVFEPISLYYFTFRIAVGFLFSNLHSIREK